MITQVAAGSGEVRLGEARATRDFTYVEDTCRALMELAQVEGGVGEVFNIGSNHEISIGDLVSLIAGVMGVPAALAADSGRLRPGTSEVLALRRDHTQLVRVSALR